MTKAYVNSGEYPTGSANNFTHCWFHLYQIDVEHVKGSSLHNARISLARINRVG